MNLTALRQAAEAGRPDAQLRLAIACLTGDGLPAQDLEQGRAWLGKAAAAGHKDAARLLGLILLRGMDVVPDMDRAVELLRQAVAAGDAEAGWWLGAYLSGTRDERLDVPQGLNYLEAAAQGGSLRAMTHWAYALDRGLAGAPDIQAAGRWFLRAARGGDAGALLALSEWFNAGRGWARDVGQARRFAELSGQRGSRVAREVALTFADTLPAQGSLQDLPAPSSEQAGSLPGPRLEVFSWQPRAILIHNFFSGFECHEVIEAAREHLKPSFIVDLDGTMRPDDIRSSHEVRLRPGLRNFVVDQVERRMADWSHFPIEHGEYPLVLRYENSQSFEQHFDYFIPERFGRGEGPLEMGGQRVATQLVYLNETFEGGVTRFNNAELEVQPERGMCLLFHNVGPDHNVDPLTRHTGVAVTGGVKWLLSRWIRELPFEQSAVDHPRDRYKND